jgi:hypothetical protein
VLLSGVLRAFALPLFVAQSVSYMAAGAVINLAPIADTTLSQNYPSNNFGGLDFANSGTTQNFTKNRALFRFDITNAIPAYSKIKNAELVLEVTKIPVDGFNPTDFALHRVLRAWGEGNKTTPTNSPGAGTGALATTNEATWFFRFAFTTNTWSQPGAGPTNDYVAAISSFQTIYGLGDSPYTFSTTALMAADVQAWLDFPQTNFGWILVSQDESVDFTARRFGSRENTNFAPRLQIEYILAPVIDRVQRVGNQFNLYFTAQPDQPYVVEFRTTANTGSWQTLANAGPFPDQTRVIVVDPIASNQRFYRLVTH